MVVAQHIAHKFLGIALDAYLASIQISQYLVDPAPRKECGWRAVSTVRLVRWSVPVGVALVG